MIEYYNRNVLFGVRLGQQRMETIELKCKKTGRRLIYGSLMFQNQFCIGVEKTYPNGTKSGMIYLRPDVDATVLS